MIICLPLLAKDYSEYFSYRVNESVHINRKPKLPDQGEKWKAKHEEKIPDEVVIFDISDPEGDDKGTGIYRYPLLRDYKRGTFDITRFRVINEPQYVVFEITLAETIANQIEYSKTEFSAVPYEENLNERNSSSRNTKLSDFFRLVSKANNGFVYQLFDIYIDMDGKPGSGHTQTIPGRNVNIDKRTAWDKMILITPDLPTTTENLLRRKTTQVLELNRIKNDIIIPRNYEVRGNKLRVKVSTKFLPKAEKKWAYQVLMLGYLDKEDPDTFYNMDVLEESRHYNFGGGSNYDGDPNVMDIIHGDKFNQYEFLSNYLSRPDKNRDVYSVIPCINEEPLR